MNRFPAEFAATLSFPNHGAFALGHFDEMN